MHISAFISYSTQLRWDKLFKYADVFGMKRLVVFVLQLVNELFDVEIPVDLCGKKKFGYVFLKKKVLEQNFDENTKPHIAMLYFTFFLLPLSKWFTIVLMRMFATKAEIRLRYNIPAQKSLKIYVYMLLNPVLMLMRKKRK